MNTRMMSASWIIRDQWNIDISKLGVPDFEAYAKALVVCVNGDGKISQPERDWIRGYLSAAGHPDSLIEMLATYDGSDKIEDLVASTEVVRQSIRTLIYDAIRACSADGEFNEAERNMVVRMAVHVGLTAADVANFEDVYKGERAAAARRIEAAYPGGVPLSFRS